jgi:hypothetical protein
LRNEINTVIPAKAGIHLEAVWIAAGWIPDVRRCRFGDDNVPLFIQGTIKEKGSLQSAAFFHFKNER